MTPGKSQNIAAAVSRNSVRERVAFTIIYSGLHHLLNKGFTEFMLSNFDLWVVVEGHAKPGGSTRWCKNMNFPVASKDGTIQFMQALSEKHPEKVVFYSHGNYWKSKDDQVNYAITLIKRRCTSAFLWQVDCDEHWTSEQLSRSENLLLNSRHNVAAFQFNHYIHDDMVARGTWGDSYVNRLWIWNGEHFLSHEPAQIKGQTGPLYLSDKFEHYSLCFEQDVKFKAKYYRGHENLYRKWADLKKQTVFPIPIKALFGTNNWIGRSDTLIHKLQTNGTN